jgi:hypothetical protein
MSDSKPAFAAFAGAFLAVFLVAWTPMGPAHREREKRDDAKEERSALGERFDGMEERLAGHVQAREADRARIAKLEEWAPKADAQRGAIVGVLQRAKLVPQQPPRKPKR